MQLHLPIAATMFSEESGGWFSDHSEMTEEPSPDFLWSLSAFAREFLRGDKQNTSGAYQGPKYFSYKGKTLNEQRKDSHR